ncbi:PREDICTED: uncharacterized protein LOC104810174 [Tarenaya hassleriana]|uniref:uncharacterized protein LOC104810174 n=1 Tax=Tarenaya hassleriana TaxID=28532 RepID=UPI00053C5D6B|nr:PREDICTED: uncharacterized protein LOC104810174 [Tarenaya hassleriana]
MTAPAKAKHSPDSGKEEGELSCSDDDGQPIPSVGKPTSTSAPVTGNSSVPLGKRQIQGHRTARGGMFQFLTSCLNSELPVPYLALQVLHHYYSRVQVSNWLGLEMIKKSVSARDNENLVISFSDDDSGSEFDIKERAIAAKVQPKVVGMSGSGNRPMPSLAKSKGPNQIDRCINKALVHNVSSCHTFSHAANSKAANPPMAKPLESSKYVSASGKKLSKKEHLSVQVVGLNSYKLQDLRQQIARRESELKLKAAQPNKDAVNQNIDSARRLTVVSADVKQLEPKEPAKKRLKVTGTDSTQPVLNDRVPVSAAIPLEEPCVKTSRLPGSGANTSCKQISGSCDRTGARAISHCIVEGNTSSNTLPKSTKEANYSGVRFGQPNFPVQTTTRKPGTIDYDGAVSSDHLLQILNGKDQPCMDNSGLWNLLGSTSVPGQSQLDIIALTNMEESLDKELEEAQEYRRMCETEERNALKAYRKAQRSLIEANTRCAELYRKREMCSAHIGSFVVHNSSLMWSSRCHERTETRFGLLNNSTENVDMGTTSDHPLHIQQQCSRDVDNVNGGQGVPSPHSGQNLGSEPCSDPDASTSDRLPYSHKQTINRLRSPSSDANISPDDDGSFLVDRESSQHNLEGRQEENHEDPQDIYNVGGNQNPLLLEASLRSKLFERLGIRAESKGGGGCSNGETMIDREAESDAASEKAQIDGNVLFPGKYRQNDFGGTDRVEENACNASVDPSPDKENSSIFQSTMDLQSDRPSPRGDLPSTSAVLPTPLFLSAFNHLMVTESSLTLLEPEHTLKNKSNSLYPNEMLSNSFVETPLSERKIGFYISDVKVDPSWPLCMYELRGRCNNDECSWQHFKDFSHDNRHQNQHDNTGFQHGSTFHRKKHILARGSQIADMMLSPTYLVCLDVMKADARSYESVIAQRHGQSWWKCFSIYLASSESLHKDIPDENEGRIEVLGNLRTQSSYFRSKHSLMNQLKQGSNAAIEPLEMALLTFCQETDEPDGLILALSLLSRCLEADPTSEILWIVYLLIYHAHERSDGKDDMFTWAVKHNRRSYALWLMYINSRRQLNDQLIAYDNALSALCGHASASDIDRKYASACILDTFLQMINLLCVSGNVTEAIQSFSRLLDPVAVSDHPQFLMLSGILTCLTFSDKCVFWVCCVYLVIYRKLPDSIVRGLETEKELLSVEWPSVDLVGDQKLMALRFFEKGLQSVELCTRSGPFEDGIEERSAHLFALNHSLFMMAIHELEKCRDLLKRYTELFPACLELKLFAARMHPSDSEDMFFSGFEELIKNPPGEGSGTQYIWNQYAEYALRGGRREFARELMARWYTSVWEVSSRRNQTVAVEDVGLNSLLNSALSDTNAADERLDVVFGYLNLSLHNQLQNNHVESCLAIDEALEATTPEHFVHCLREHASIQLINEIRATGGFPISLQLRLLKYYTNQASSLFPAKEPLSWKFIIGAEKPRVRKLVSNLLTPASSEFVVVNVVLEAWYGPSLLPRKPSKHKDLVDFVEAVLELVPSNYPLALSVCKVLRNERNDSSDIYPAGIHFWAGLNLVSTISGAVPIPPEHMWVEAGEILSGITGFKTRAENFLTRGLSVYPFSVELWKCYRRLSKSIGNTEEVEEKARGKGMKLVD